MANRINDVFEAVQNNLEDGVGYNSVYDIELAAGLVELLVLFSIVCVLHKSVNC